MKKVSEPIKKLFKQAKANPLIAGAVAIVVVVLVGGIVLVASLGGDDKTDDSTSTAKETQQTKKDPGIEKAKRRKVKPAPVVSGSGTLDVARSVGTFAVAQGRGRIKNPSSIAVRVSAAPKQTVTVDYQLACYKESGTRIGKGRYRPRPPDTRNIPIPISGAKECTVTVGAQLTSHRPGRIKVAIISG